jgi:acyl-CoA synthetase (AMP-forming)/AMP-acid ligase II
MTEEPWALHADGSQVLALADIIRRRATATPDAVALQEPQRLTTFAALDERSSAVANALVGEGVVPGDRVGFIGANGPEFLEVLYGATKAGAIATAVNNRLAGPEVLAILADSAPRVVVVDAEAEPLVKGLDGLGFPCQVRVVGADFDGWRDAASAVDPNVPVGPDDTALILYTSGTTGRPKGIELTGRNLGCSLASLHEGVVMGADSVCAAPVPFFHVAGLSLALAAALRGGRLLLEQPSDMAGVVRLLVERQVTHAVLIPTVLQWLLALPETRQADWSRLQYVVYGASPIPLSVLTEATEVFGCHFLQSYGLTETAGGFTLLSAEDHRNGARYPERLRSAGRPLAGVRIRIVDPVTLQDLPAGERGEVLVTGSRVMKGYWGQPALTAQTVMPGGWLRTGDGGSLDADGYLFLHDRLTDMIVTGGENVYPAEVESVMTGHPAVAEVAVLGVPSERWGESPYAVVVLAPGAEVTEADLLGWTRDRLAHFKCPVGVTITAALPRTASGKLQKVVLRRQLLDPAPA